MNHRQISFCILVLFICLGCTGIVAGASTAMSFHSAAPGYDTAVKPLHVGLSGLKGTDGYDSGVSPVVVQGPVNELKGRYPVLHRNSSASGWGYPVTGSRPWQGSEVLTLSLGGTEVIQDTGEVVCIDEEGGVFGIITGDGTHYFASNFPQKYKKEGLHVLFKAYKMPINPAYRMWGNPIRIISIQDDPAWKGTIETTGTVSWIDLEGGFFGIIADDGTHYDPLNLPEQYEQDGLRIRFTASEEPDVASFHMWGTFITITQVSLMDGSESSKNDVMVEYRRTGGFAGFNDHLIIYENGTALVTTRNNDNRYTLSTKELNELIALFESSGFNSLTQGELPMFKVSGNDFFNYSIEFRGHKIEAIEYAFPDSINPLIEKLNDLVTRGMG